ncbi:hypothetical protein T261_1531 [Streptomyces lydicus]|nr:hypothetical protein T261_1531 [Streptomyces lydicus]
MHGEAVCRAQIGMSHFGKVHVELIDQDTKRRQEKKGKRVAGALGRHGGT